MRQQEHILVSVVVVVVLLLLQSTFIPLISLLGVVPDLLLIWLVSIALRRGQIEATVAGFAAGLLQDIVATKFLGLAALAKTVTGFILGYFYNENTTEATLGSYRFTLLVLLAGFIHNLLYFFIFLQNADEVVLVRTIGLSLAHAIYSAVIAILVMFLFSRRFRTAAFE